MVIVSRSGPHAGSASRAVSIRADDRDGLRRWLSDAVRQVGLPPVGADSRAVLLVRFTPPTPTNSGLVHELIDVLFEIGWPSVAVAGRLTQRDVDSGRDDVIAMAADAGFGGSTGAGRIYDVLDLATKLSVATVPPTSVLSARVVSSVWESAGLRIVIARGVPDPVDGYLGCLETLLAAAPAVPGAEPGDVAADLLTHLPPDLSIVDATASSDGADDLAAGSMAATAVLSDDCLLADVVMARLHSIDPAMSRLLRAALSAPGLPAEYVIEGDQTPLGWPPSASPLLADALHGLAASAPALERVIESLLAGPGDDADEVLRWLQRTLLPVLEPTGPAGPALLAGLAYSITGSANWLQGWMTVLAKDRLERVEVPLGFDPNRYAQTDFDGIAGYLAGFDPLIDSASVVDEGMKWCQHDRAVLFEVERVIDAPFGDFVERVDISRGIGLMADYLGGRVVPVQHDSEGRVVWQAERNLYLPQPNYLALWGGLPIDVCKIEKVEYPPGARRLLWRTVLSPNQSATYDDGSLTFADEGGGRTRLTVRGRQLFALPPFWQAVDLDRFPEFKAPLVTDAYRRFFTVTFDNIEASYEGRDFLIGRAAANPGPLPTATLTALLEMAREWLAATPLTDRIRDRFARPRPEPVTVDRDGFRHFTAAPLATAPASAATPDSVGAFTALLQTLAADYVTAFGMDSSRSAPL